MSVTSSLPSAFAALILACTSEQSLLSITWQYFAFEPVPAFWPQPPWILVGESYILKGKGKKKNLTFVSSSKCTNPRAMRRHFKKLLKAWTVCCSRKLVWLQVKCYLCSLLQWEYVEETRSLESDVSLGAPAVIHKGDSRVGLFGDLGLWSSYSCSENNSHQLSKANLLLKDYFQPRCRVILKGISSWGNLLFEIHV